MITDYRGEVEYSENDIIEFVDSMYGFDERYQFLLIGNIEPNLPFHWLQSIDDEKLTFVVTDPFLFTKNYDFELDDFTVEQLELTNIDDIMIYTTVIIPEDLEQVTVNLKSPIVLNMKSRKAKQIIVNEDYPYKHKIFKKGEN